MKLLPVGSEAPDFTLSDQAGEPVNLASLRGQTVVVYFYPKAMTPGCTVQACGIRDSRAELEKRGIQVLALSPDPVKRLAKFAERDQLNFRLLADEDHAVADTYGVWGLKQFMGREYEGVHRVTYIIDAQGNIASVMPKVNTKTHHQDVLNWIADNLPEN
jgi:thioredoxin-dependent peroxiredoxin